MYKWITYGALLIVSVVLLATIVGAIYETMGRSRAAREYPPQGKLVDIGGRRIQMDCRGAGSPTVIFESGLDIIGSLSWSAVHDEIAKTTRACAYSRAGIMWSDRKDGPQNAKTIAEDLHAALVKAGEKPPLVLVGHSLGGPYVMAYTKYYGADVAGLVFVDASHPEQEERFKAVTSASLSGKTMWLFKAGSALAWTGVVRASPLSSKGAPNQPDQSIRAMAAYASTSLGPMLKEVESTDETLAEAGTYRQLGNRPLYVLTAMKPLPEAALANLGLTPEQGRQFKAIWKGMQDEEASWSSRSQHKLVPDAGHYIQFERPDVVIAAVRSVVEQVRANEESTR